MGFIDTHVHLHFPEYDSDRNQVIDQARQEGIEGFINVGTDVQSSEASLDLAQSYDFIYATAGIHPHDAKLADDKSFQTLELLLQNERMVAIGEVGLDFFRDHSPHDIQKEVLRRFLDLQKKIKKPLVLHCRDAYEDLMTLLKEESKPPFNGIMHCYSSDKSVMKRFLDLGFYISFAGPLTYKKNDLLREACQACPLDRLLLETDAPFLPPQSVRGKRNESRFMNETAQVVADLHKLSLSDLGDCTTANAKTVFKLC